MFPIIVSGIVNVYLGYNTTSQFIKVSVGLLASSSFFYYIIRHYNFNIEHLFKVYMIFCVAVAVIGVIQLIGSIVRIGPLYNFRWIFNKWAVVSGGLKIRVNSIFSEPSYYATTLAPCFFISCLNVISKKALFISKKWSWFVVLTYFLSFSSLGILAGFLTIFFILFRFGYITQAILFVPLSLLAFILTYNFVPEFRDRFDSSIEIFFNDDFDRYSVHGSAFVLADNYQVAEKNLREHPFFGTGLGSHEIAFEKYSLTKQMFDIGLDGNAKDANSMFVRLMSETGLYGIIFMIIFLVRNFNGVKSALNEEMWAISTGCLILILIYLLRQGNYFYNGFPFFLWIYYYTNKISKNAKSMANVS